MNIDAESRALLQYINEDFVLYVTGGRTVAYHIASGDSLNKEGFKHYCAQHYGDIVAIEQDKDGNQVERRMDSGPIWWEWTDPNRRVIRRFVMEPNEHEEIDDPLGSEVYNLWYQYKKEMVIPDGKSTVEDIQIFLNHLMYISDNDEVIVMFFMNWLAQLYQHPGVKVPTAVMMYSKNGRIGKSMIYKLLRQVFGKPLCVSSDGSKIQSKFMDGIEHKRIVFLNEMSRADKMDGYERFKSLVSEEEAMFEGKGVAARTVQNFAHYIITTNHEDAMPLMERDGRIAIFRCLAERQPNAYYAEVHEWFDGPGPAAVANVLANWTFPKDWDPAAPVPQTEAAQAVQRASRGNLAQLVEELIEGHRQPFDKDIGNITALTEQVSVLYPQNTKGLGNRALPLALERVGAIQLPKIGYINKEGKQTTTRVWCWRDIERWKAATGKEIAETLGLL